LAFVFGERIIRHLQGNVGNGESKVEEKRARLVFAHKTEGILGHEIVSVMFADELLAAFVALEHFLLGVAPKMIGIIIVSLPLAQIAIKIIEALAVGFSSAARAAEAPFADAACFVAGCVQEVAKCKSPSGDGPLSFRGEFTIITYIGVAGMLAGEKHAARRRTDRTAGVKLSKAHPPGGKPINVGRFDLRLTVTAEFGVAQVIGQQEDDIGGRVGSPGQTRDQKHQQSRCKKFRANARNLAGGRLQFKAPVLEANLDLDLK
jgi:hypothetical protein